MLLDRNIKKDRLIDTILSKKANISWFYPHICSYQDKIEDKRAAFFGFLEGEPTSCRHYLLYVHIPFCHNFCTYCGCFKERYGAFNADELEHFVDCLIDEIEWKAGKRRLQGAKIKYISFGGGTPSILDNPLYGKLFAAFRRFFDLSELEGVVLEGNVMSLMEEGKVETLKEAGVTRLSFGVQSFDAAVRKSLAVVADPDDVHRLAEKIHSHGLPFAIDLIYNLPLQTPEMVAEDLRHAYAIQSDYVHTYLFNQYPSTHIDGRVKDAKYAELPSPEKEVAMYRLIHESHMANGYENQMFINFYSRKPEDHLVSMELQLGWNRLHGANVIGIGPGAFSYIDGYNFKNYRDVRRYMADIDARQFPSDIGNFTDVEELKHRVMVYFPIFTRIKKQAVPEGLGFHDILERLISEGYVQTSADEYQLTLQGKIWGGNIAQLFYSESQREKKLKSYYYCVKHEANPFNTDGMNVSKKRSRSRTHLQVSK